MVMPRTLFTLIEEEKFTAVFFLVYDPSLPAPAFINVIHF
jgi:hypothetical protein